MLIAPGTVFRNCIGEDGDYNIFMIRKVKTSGKVLLYNCHAQRNPDGTTTYSKFEKDTTLNDVTDNELFWKDYRCTIFSLKPEEYDRILRSVGFPKV